MLMSTAFGFIAAKTEALMNPRVSAVS